MEETTFIKTKKEDAGQAPVNGNDFPVSTFVKTGEYLREIRLFPPQVNPISVPLPTWLPGGQQHGNSVDFDLPFTEPQ
jgi:hypothetical protein